MCNRLIGGKINMIKILCKPCFAFDALSAIALHTVTDDFRNDIPYVKTQAEKYFKDINIAGSDSYFGLLVEKYSLEEIENMDLNEFVDIYSTCIKGNEFEEQFLNGLQILKEMDFTHLWEDYCLPFLKRQCDEYNSILEKENQLVTGVLSDIQFIKPNEKIEDINIYMTYFTQCLSCAIGKNSYITNHEENEEINTKNVLRLFTHELIHGISNEKTRSIYVKVCETDELMKKSKFILRYRKSCSSNEEEIVVAFDHYISMKNKLMTKEETYQSIFSWYDYCMPVAIIIFDELVKLNKLPEDINSWIYNLFTNGTIQADNIENKVNDIMPGYITAFKNRWNKEYE